MTVITSTASIDAKEDGTWLYIKGTKYQALIRLEAVVRDGSFAAKAIEELRELLLKEKAHQ